MDDIFDLFGKPPTPAALTSEEVDEFFATLDQPSSPIPSDVVGSMASSTVATDYTRSFTPDVIPEGVDKGRTAAKEKRAWLLKQFLRARQVGMGISTVQILRCLRTTVAPARVWELVQAGWAIENRGACSDSSDLYVLVSDVQGPPIKKLLGWEGALFDGVPVARCEPHSHHVALGEEERADLDRYMTACLRAWVAQHKPAWSRFIL